MFSQSLFSLNAKFTLYLKNNFKNTPEASANTGLVINYVLSGNVMVIVLDNWILCCGQRAVALVLHSVFDHHSVTRRTRSGATTESTVLTVQSVIDILCMHTSHMDYIPQNWDCCKYFKELEVPFTCLLEDF